MIRDYVKSDLDEIIKLYTLEYKAMPEEIETLKNASKILVYDDLGIKGFIHLIMVGHGCYVEMGATSDELIRTIGLKLWKEAEKLFEKNSIDFVQVFHVKDNEQWQQFFSEIGFEYWYSVFRLSYKGEKFEEPNLCVVAYEDKYYEDKIRLESEAFSVLRKESDIKPYNWYLSASKEALDSNRKWILKDKECIYLFCENEDIIGATMVKNAEIELLFVNTKYQKQGYGKKILEFSVNRGLEQNLDAVNLNVLASNEGALKLYISTGFENIQAQDCRRLIKQ